VVKEYFLGTEQSVSVVAWVFETTLEKKIFRVDRMKEGGFFGASFLRIVGFLDYFAYALP